MNSTRQQKSLQPPNVTGDVLLAELHRQLIREYTPVIAFAATAMVVGIGGNSLAFFYYGFKAKTKSSSVFIASLAATDVFVCIMYSWHILDLCYNVYFDNAVVCKFDYFFSHWTVVSSVLLLESITFDRYLKICRPFAKQFNVSRTKKTVVIVIALTAVYSLRDFIILDTIQINMLNTNGTFSVVHYCTHTDSKSLEVIVFVSHLIDLVIAAVVTLTLVILYTLVIIRLVKLKRNISSSGMETDGNNWNVRSSKPHRSLDSDQQHGVSPAMETGIYIIDTANDDSTEQPDTNKIPTGACMHSYQKHRTTNVFRISSAERNITYSMVIITIAFVCSFVPYFFFIIDRRVKSVTLQSELTIGPQFLFRSFMLNSVINPFVYCFFNTQFREFLFNICR